MEGASWWAKAFEAAGFKDAFQVEVLPDDADPMDLRYNVIQWVHRSTRGWSYGTSVIDPRTGEILKGRVTLDSLRARQDALIGTGLVDRRAAPGALRRRGRRRARSTWPGLDPSAEPAAMVLARIRQLSAHEVGHTLGLAHNFAASTYGRASVMDYPAPLVKIRDGKTLDLSDAYARGIGAYDVFADPLRLRPVPARGRRGEGARARSSARASPTACCSCPTPTPAPPARPTRWPTSGTTATTRSPSLRHEMEVRRDRPRAVRPRQPRRRGAALRPRGQAPAALPAPPLPAPGGRQDARAASDYTYAVKDGDAVRPVVDRAGRAGRPPARGARRGAGDARPEGARRSPTASST